MYSNTRITLSFLSFTTTLKKTNPMNLQVTAAPIMCDVVDEHPSIEVEVIGQLTI